MNAERVPTIRAPLYLTKFPLTLYTKIHDLRSSDFSLHPKVEPLDDFCALGSGSDSQTLHLVPRARE